MTITSGLRSGLRTSIRSGLNPSDAALSGVTRDATSLIYAPATNGEVGTVRTAAGLAAGAPTSIWLMQDASGGAADVNTTNALSEFGTVTYQNALAGWSRKFIGTADAGAGSEIASTAASLPDVSATSVLIIAYVALPTAPAASRTLMNCGSVGTSFQIRVSTTPTFTAFHGANNAAGASNLGATVRPHVMRHNLTASTAMYCTDQEKTAPTFDATITGKRLDFGGADLAAPAMRIGYALMFTGAAAELSDAQVKTLLQTLGWTVAW